MNRSSRTYFQRTLKVLAASAAVLALTGPASAQDTFKVGIVTFLSGPAAESFGVPAGKAAEEVESLFASLIVMLVFLPIFFLGGVAGTFFRPLAVAYVLAIAASLLVLGLLNKQAFQGKIDWPMIFFLLSLDGLITHHAAADEADRAYRTAFGDAGCLKMVLDWRHHA